MLNSLIVRDKIGIPTSNNIQFKTIHASTNHESKDQLQHLDLDMCLNFIFICLRLSLILVKEINWISLFAVNSLLDKRQKLMCYILNALQ